MYKLGTVKPPIPPILGLVKKRRYSENGSIGSHILKQLKNRCLGKWAALLPIGRAAVLGGAVLRWTTVHILKLKVIIHRAQDAHKDPVCEAECGLYSMLCEDYCITCL